MCKQTDFPKCSELGDNVCEWSRDTPLAKPAWIEETFTDFGTALQEVINGNLESARSILKASRDHDLRIWFDVHAQNTGTWRYKALGKIASRQDLSLDPVKSFSSLERGLFTRDNYRCRYCGSGIVPKRAFKEAQQMLGSNCLPLGRTNRERSGFYLMFAGTLDHVIPWSLGGRTDASNLVTSCWSCNYGKSNYTLEQLGLDHPLDREPVGDLAWTNLVEVLLNKLKAVSQQDVR